MPADHAELIRRQAPSLEAAFTTMVDRASPALRERLRDRRASDVRGTMRLPNHVRRCVGQGWALVGDAGYHRDPVTGHGITDALRDAELLACALDRSLRRDEPEMWALQAYQAERDEMIADIFRITVALAEFPPPNRFVELQKELGQAMDDEATALAARPRPGLLLAA
jgi:2-polyprenyl-6-methoxyphenol hydroxylase-like FAD-dependent oxidoreductase